jgi:hypothetical protein
MLLRTFALGLAGGAAALAATGSATPTFYKDVLPVLQNHCQECHRPGEVAPMSFMTYDEARPWAKAIRQAVITKKMPPWFADPHFGKFSNDRSLTQSAMDTLVAWADGGAKAGDKKEAPAPREFFAGWQIGKPDMVIRMPEAVDIPATGVVEYTYVVLPTGFTEDKWIQFAEARPDARTAMHHIIAFVRPPGAKWLSDAKPGVPFVPQRDKRRQGGGDDGVPGELLVGFAPGLPPTQCKPGEAKLVRAGSDIILQLHYTPNGKATSDRSSIGVTFAKEVPARRQMTMNALNVFLKIPPGDPNYEVHSQTTLNADVNLVNMMPHMHLRGKDFEYRAVYPTGETQTLLKVPNYDFNWQLAYVEAGDFALPKGTRIECTAHFDNSANNKYNPDPTKEVKWGDQTWEEMMIGWFDVSFDAKTDPTKALRARPTRGD